MWEISGFTREIGLGDLLRAGAYLVGGAAVGYLLYRILLARVKKRASITTWGGDHIILTAIHDVVMVWFTTGGAYVAARSLPLQKGVMSAIDRGLLAVGVVSATWVGARVAADAIRLLSLRSGTAGRGSSIFLNVARIVIIIVGVLVLLQTFGMRIAPLLAALGVGGLAIALALQEPMSNFFAGIQILATKKVRPGHFVRLDSGEEGHIVDIDWRHTSIRQLPNNMILVPNAKLADAVVTNFDYPDQETAVLVEVGVHYKSDLDHVERVTVDVAADVMTQVPGGVPDFSPFVRFHTFGDSSIDFTVILRASEATGQYLVKHEFIKRLKRRYREEGIAIPFPIVEIADKSPSRDRAITSQRSLDEVGDRG